MNANPAKFELKAHGGSFEGMWDVSFEKSTAMRFSKQLYSCQIFVAVGLKSNT